MANKFATFLTRQDYGRLSNITEESVSVDVHGLNRYEAKRLIKNICAMYRGNSNVTVIHGYTHGSVILEMLRTEKDFLKKQYTVKTVAQNPGISIICI